MFFRCVPTFGFLLITSVAWSTSSSSSLDTTKSLNTSTSTQSSSWDFSGNTASEISSNRGHQKETDTLPDINKLVITKSELEGTDNVVEISSLRGLLLMQLKNNPSFSNFAKIQRLQNRMMEIFLSYRELSINEASSYSVTGYEPLKAWDDAVIFRTIDKRGEWQNSVISPQGNDPVTGEQTHKNPAFQVAMNNLWLANRNDCDENSRKEFLEESERFFLEHDKFNVFVVSDRDIQNYLTLRTRVNKLIDPNYKSLLDKGVSEKEIKENTASSSSSSSSSSSLDSTKSTHSHLSQ